MGGVPKQRHTKSRRDKRRSQIVLKAVVLSVCPHCQKTCLPHAVCPSCGYYRGREVINILKKQEKREKHERQKETSS